MQYAEIGIGTVFVLIFKRLHVVQANYNYHQSAPLVPEGYDKPTVIVHYVKSKKV